MTACGEVAKDGRQEKNGGKIRMKERLMKQQAQICLCSSAGERHCFSASISLFYDDARHALPIVAPLRDICAATAINSMKY